MKPINNVPRLRFSFNLIFFSNYRSETLDISPRYSSPVTYQRRLRCRLEIWCHYDLPPGTSPFQSSFIHSFYFYFYFFFKSSFARRTEIYIFTLVRFNSFVKTIFDFMIFLTLLFLPIFFLQLFFILIKHYVVTYFFTRAYMLS